MTNLMPLHPRIRMIARALVVAACVVVATRYGLGNNS